VCKSSVELDVDNDAGGLRIALRRDRLTALGSSAEKSTARAASGAKLQDHHQPSHLPTLSNYSKNGCRTPTQEARTSRAAG
jgi:hypothetical protein